MIKPIFCLALLLAGGGALAQEQGGQPADEAEVPAPPAMPDREPMPERAPQLDLPPPTVTIRREDEQLIEEYSIQGRVYMVRVTPKNAPPYVLVDMHGTGELRRADTEVGPHIHVPHWILFEW